ncbi:epidermal growth factor receptor kinase substrate 8-like protein 1 [Protopterus annectens]|uniref:epidermal growth factor receptor kinase substrate 8-like protein 1 n=1 Tax=Protopterus annectens TaxID=7888 RepID=UPI001CFAEFD6|nr:epidermal growth factor receptor kinase substrate 8-like protein 1 [Protopterus annectens]
MDVPFDSPELEQRKKYSSFNFIAADTSQYAVNHLVTFAISSEDEVHTVEEAVRKLTAMDAKGKIWTQEMLLKVNTNGVDLYDVESTEHLEHYPLPAIQRCEAILSDNRFHSLLLLVCQDITQLKPDIHFFQCDEVGADLIRDDINGAISDHKSGKNVKRPEALSNNTKKMNALNDSPRQPSKPAPKAPFTYNPFGKPLDNKEDPTVIYSQVNKSNREKQSVNNTYLYNREQNLSGDMSSLGDVHSLDGRSSLGGSNSTLDRSSIGDRSNSPDPHASIDIVALRAERDVEILNHTFDDIESFMGKLQKAAEAFKVLQQRRKFRKSNKKKEVGEGLLTIRAKPPTEEEYIDVLQKFKYCFSLLAKLRNNIVNPNASELVHYLFGPLEQVVQSVGGPEIPREVISPMMTKDGVSLLNNCLNEKEMALWKSLGDYWTKPRTELPRDQYIPYSIRFLNDWEPSHLDPNGEPWEDPVEMQLRHEGLRSQQSANPVLQPAVLNGHPEGQGRYIRCTYDFVARNSNELSVLHGETLEVLNDSKRWWKAKNRYGEVGYVPYNILTPISAQEFHESRAESGSPRTKSPPTTPVKKVIPPSNVPSNVNTNGTAMRDVPDGKSADSKDRERANHMNVINEELLLRLTSGRTTPQKTFQVQRSSDTSIPLTYESSPSEVKAWLEAKGFSAVTVNSLGILNGAQLFSLQKQELRSVSPEEGARVYSQLMVQKSIIEDNKRISELEVVMKRQKKKVDTEIGLEQF